MANFKIQTLNSIAVTGLDRLPRDRYEVASEVSRPDAILLRSFKMHDLPIPESLLASRSSTHRAPMRMPSRSS
jgi:D-3-phosphoglycerate dehydrogenase